MRIVVIGDPHLSGTENPFTTSIVDDWNAIDCILVVGDVLDHSSQTVRAARDFYNELDSIGIPVLTIPGNHDYTRMSALIDGFCNVQNLHESRVTVAETSIAGLGSEQFDAGPEIRYPQFGSCETVWDETRRQKLLCALRQDESAVADVLSSAESEETIPEAVHISFQRYQSRYDRLTTLVDECDTTEIVLIVHVPPFDSSLDRIADHRPVRSGLHWGSMALRNVLKNKDISAVVCGHIHEGEGTESIEGTFCLNAGTRSFRLVEITVDGVTTDWTQTM